MIHTDGRPTIANCGPIPGVDTKSASKLYRLAADLAAARGCTIEEALKALSGQPR